MTASWHWDAKLLRVCWMSVSTNELLLGLWYDLSLHILNSPMDFLYILICIGRTTYISTLNSCHWFRRCLQYIEVFNLEKKITLFFFFYADMNWYEMLSLKCYGQWELYSCEVHYELVLGNQKQIWQENSILNFNS